MTGKLVIKHIELATGVVIAMPDSVVLPPSLRSHHAVGRSESPASLVILPDALPGGDEELDRWRDLGNVLVWSPGVGHGIQALSDSLAVLRADARDVDSAPVVLGPLHEVGPAIRVLTPLAASPFLARPHTDGNPVVVSLGFQEGSVASALIQGMALASCFAKRSIELRTVASMGDRRVLAIFQTDDSLQIDVELFEGESERSVRWAAGADRWTLDLNEQRLSLDGPSGGDSPYPFAGPLERPASTILEQLAADLGQSEGPPPSDADSKVWGLPVLTDILFGAIASVSATLRERSRPVEMSRVINWNAPDRVIIGYRRAAEHWRQRRPWAAAAEYETLMLQNPRAEFTLAAIWYRREARQRDRSAQLASRSADHLLRRRDVGPAAWALAREKERPCPEISTPGSRIPTCHFLPTSGETVARCPGTRRVMVLGESAPVYPYEIELAYGPLPARIELGLEAAGDTPRLRIRAHGTPEVGRPAEGLIYWASSQDPSEPGALIVNRVFASRAPEIELHLVGVDLHDDRSSALVLRVHFEKVLVSVPILVHSGSRPRRN